MTQSQANRPATPKRSADSIESVTIAPTLQELANYLAAENNTMSTSSQVLELKSKINNNEYKIDIDELTRKLSNTLVGSKMV